MYHPVRQDNSSSARDKGGSGSLARRKCLAYWVITAEQDAPIPVGTTRIIERQPLGDGRVKWIVEGAEFMNVLAGVVKGIISVERFYPENEGEDRHSVA